MRFYICIHVRIKYGVNISSITKEIQEKIAVAVKQMTDVDVQHINIEVIILNLIKQVRNDFLTFLLFIFSTNCGRMKYI